MFTRIALVAIMTVGLAGCEADLSNLLDNIDTDPIGLDTDTFDTDDGDTGTASENDTETGEVADTDSETDSGEESIPYLTIVAELVDPAAEGWTQLGYDDDALDTYRVYVQLSGAGITVFSIGDLGDASESLTVASDNGAFFNSEHSRNRAPNTEYTDEHPDILWDTFVTIGEHVAAGFAGYPLTRLAPGFTDQAGSLEGDFSLEDSGWYIMESPAASISGADGRVLLGQFTVDEGIHIDGTNWTISCLDRGTTYNELADWTTDPSE